LTESIWTAIEEHLEENPALTLDGDEVPALAFFLAEGACYAIENCRGCPGRCLEEPDEPSPFFSMPRVERREAFGIVKFLRAMLEGRKGL